MLTGKAKVFSGNANLPLAQKIADYLHLRLGKADIMKFSDGEVRVEINEHVRAHDIFIIQPTCAPANDSLMELLVMADALKRSSVHKITAVVPYYGYSRQDRRPDFTRTPITSRLVAKMMQTAGIDELLVVDLHSGQQKGFFDIPVMNISASPEIVGDIWRHYNPDELIVVSPDTGGVVRARSVAKQLDNADLAIIDKRRPEANVSEVMNIIGDVKGKDCVLIDDMIDTAGTLCKGAAALKEAGARKVTAYATHPVFSGAAYDNISESELDEVVVTDTIPIAEGWSNLDADMLPAWQQKIRVLSTTSILGETIRRIQSGVSVSEMYME